MSLTAWGHARRGADTKEAQVSRVEEIIARLGASDPKAQTAALEEAGTAVNDLSAAAVEALRVGPNRFLVAERLHLLGSAVCPSLQRLMRQTEEPETQVLGAL